MNYERHLMRLNAIPLLCSLCAILTPAAVRGQAPVTKTGYVWEYTTLLPAQPLGKDGPVYFSILISSKADTPADTARFVLVRNIDSGVDATGAGDTWAVSYATASAAVISTVQAAFSLGKPVTVEAFLPTAGLGRGLNLPWGLISSVTIGK